MSTSHEKELFENKPVFGAIMELALPSVVGQIILVIYNMADTFFIGLAGRAYESVTANAMLTAATVCMPAFMFLSAISNLFGVGGASVIARSIGEKNEDRARRASSFAIWGCLAVAALYSLGAFIFNDGFVDLLGGASESVHPLATGYMLIAVAIGGIPTAMNTLFSHLLRSEGKSFQASLGIVLGGVLNIALDPLFMFVFLKGNEVIGAALATMISNVIALGYFIFILAKDRKKLIISVKPTLKSLRDRIPLDIIIVGIPACLMTLCENISYAILDNLMQAGGDAAQAGVGVAKKVNMLAHSVVRGMTQGVLPLIGYNFASGNRKRMKSVLYMSAAMSVGVSLVCTTASLVFATPLCSLFMDSQSNVEAISFGAKFLRILCVGAPFSAWAYTVISFFQATGHGGKSLILALMRKGILDIPLMFALKALLARVNILGFTHLDGIVMATPIADMICCATAVVLFAWFMKKHAKNGVSVNGETKMPEEVYYD